MSERGIKQCRELVISLGAGVQSSALALMAARGEFGTVPRYAVFADTGHEPPAVYAWLDQLEAELKDRIEVVRVKEGDLLTDATTAKFNPIPLYLRNADGSASAGRRQCTKVYKLYPIRHWLRAQGIDPVEMWLGISLDEVQRMKPSGLQWIENRWPLVEKRMTREDCKRWMRDNGYPEPPKSACYFCPYKRDREYVQMRDNDPESFAKAVAADEAMRHTADGREQFVSASLIPLSELRSAEDLGQTVLDFNDECEGMCGV